MFRLYLVEWHEWKGHCVAIPLFGEIEKLAKRRRVNTHCAYHIVYRYPVQCAHDICISIESIMRNRVHGPCVLQISQTLSRTEFIFNVVNNNARADNWENWKKLKFHNKMCVANGKTPFPFIHSLSLRFASAHSQVRRRTVPHASRAIIITIIFMVVNF